MNWTRWLPLRYIVRRAARSQGFLDPIELLARLRSFAQPSEVGEPVELLRAGAIFHARGLINSKVIQHNLDWVWPYWIARQYDPNDESFTPRAFSISHINLTHRNWTAIGYPDCEELPIVDPRGLLTPFFDSWSVDCWIVTPTRTLLPSRQQECRQWQELEEGLAVVTEVGTPDLSLRMRAEVVAEAGEAVCRMRVSASSDEAGWLVIALRPLNPEGISFINEVALTEDGRSWRIDDRTVSFSRPVVKHFVSDYSEGDVFRRLLREPEQQAGSCPVGLTTAAAMFPLAAATAESVELRIPLQAIGEGRIEEGGHRRQDWMTERAATCQLRCPEQRFQMLYDAAITSLILHSPQDVYPGPYTYKRFWFRDAAFIIHALLCAGMNERAARALNQFPQRQTALGYFRSQEGEWDANGEVLWILRRYEQLTGRRLDAGWDSAVLKGARWITRKRLPEQPESPHAGLLPPGFSAEHLGLNDYYYWDDFWGVAGLRAAAELLRDRDPDSARECEEGAASFSAAIERSLRSCEERLGRPAMPASPYRRLDAGAVGSLAVGYPLQDCSPQDPRLLDCVDYLMNECFVHGAFFQDMIHSGVNAYLSLEIAQILLRAGDPRYLEVIDAVARLASPTGQWPEAIHPRTGGGCMGDGHHVWAAAEWVLMMRNLFVREEGSTLILAAGVPERWLQPDTEVAFGPAPTDFGTVSIRLLKQEDGSVRVDWDCLWRDECPPVEIRLPGFKPVSPDMSQARNHINLVRTGPRESSTI